MATITGQATDPLSPGVLGQPMEIDVPSTFAIGVKGDGGNGSASPFPGQPVPGRMGIGVLGTTSDAKGAGVRGENTAGGNAGYFDGNVTVTGRMNVTGTVTSQAIDPVSPGVLGQPMEIDLPSTFAIGVKGDGGKGSASPFPGQPVPGRMGIGVLGTTSDAKGAGVRGENTAGGNAGYFDGNVAVTGNVTVTGNAAVSGSMSVTGDHRVTGTVFAEVDVVLGSDCAEDFDVAPFAEIEPGTVMVLDDSGALRPSQDPYDKKVAGVISGAGDFRPGLILGRSDSAVKRMPLALMGKVYCKVDAQYEPVEVGDMLTTSPTLGHAMRAVDPLKAFGAVIGKALRPLESGQGLIPILIALQ